MTIKCDACGLKMDEGVTHTLRDCVGNLASKIEDMGDDKNMTKTEIEDIAEAQIDRWMESNEEKLGVSEDRCEEIAQEQAEKWIEDNFDAEDTVETFLCSRKGEKAIKAHIEELRGSDPSIEELKVKIAAQELMILKLAAICGLKVEEE
jgi:hypothetical protein